MTEIIKNTSRVLVGIVFMFSGFVKAVDPLGSTYKFSDYFTAFRLDFLSPLALPLAILLSSSEFLVGSGLILAYRMRITAWAALCFMTFFTLLTLVIAVKNPVTDCGCFGDALILTNWQTFIKNIVISLLTAVIFLQRNKYFNIRRPVIEWSVLAVIFGSTVLFSLYNFNHLPLLDFRPFSIGSGIPAGMRIPEGAPRDVYETRLVYKNKSTGEEKVFSVESIPDDAGWEFVSSDSRLVSAGYEPPIHDFSITAPNGQESTREILENTGYTFLLVSYDLHQADSMGLIHACQYSKIALSLPGLDFFALTASTAEDVIKIKERFKLDYDFYRVDEIVLKTIIRSNPGLVLLKNGIVIDKWHFNDFPDPESYGPGFSELLTSFPLSPGTDLNSLRVPPVGSRPDSFRTVLTFLNTFDGRTDTFPPYMIPPERNWKLLNSQSILVKKGIEMPLSDFRMLSPEGEELSEKVYNYPYNTFLVITGDPRTLKTGMMDQLNSLTTQTFSSPGIFYGLTNLDPEEIRSFRNSFISPIIFCTVPSSFIEKTAGDGVLLVWLRNGRIMEVWKDEGIPSPADFETILSNPAGPPDFETTVLPQILKAERLIREKQTVYLFIIGFILFALILRIYFEGSSPSKK